MQNILKAHGSKKFNLHKEKSTMTNEIIELTKANSECTMLNELNVAIGTPLKRALK